MIQLQRARAAQQVRDTGLMQGRRELAIQRAQSHARTR
jgi:hypothetical protein